MQPRCVEIQLGLRGAADVFTLEVTKQDRRERVIGRALRMFGISPHPLLSRDCQTAASCNLGARARLLEGLRNTGGTLPPKKKKKFGYPRVKNYEKVARLSLSLKTYPQTN